MIPPKDCPYYGKLTAVPCWKCPSYIPDTDECKLTTAASAVVSNAGQYPTLTATARSYEERMRDYERERDELLKLSKEALVDLIIHRPTPY